MHFGPYDSTIRRMIGATIVRRAADRLVETLGSACAIQFLDDHWKKFGISLDKFGESH